MKSIFTKISAIALGMTMALGVGAGIVASTYKTAEEVNADSIGYSLVFKDSGGNADSSSAYKTSTSLDTVFSSGSSIVSAISSTSNVYSAKTGYGAKFSSSSNGGTITFSLSESIDVTKIVCSLARYDNSKDAAATFTVNDQTVDSLTTSFVDYTFNLNTSVSTLTLTAVKRLYVTHVDLYVDGGGAPATTVTSMSASPSSYSVELNDTIPTPTVTASGSIGVDVPYSLYKAEVGTLSGSTFTSRANLVFGSTPVIIEDNLIRLTAKDPIEENGSTYAVCDIPLTVSYATLTGLELSDTTLSINADSEHEGINVTPIPSNANGAVVWASSNEDAVIIDENTGAMITGSSGTAVVTAYSTINPSISASCTVTVVEAKRYILVESLLDLKDGDTVVFAGEKEGTYKAMASQSGTQYRNIVDATESDGFLYPASGAVELTVGRGVTNTDAYTFFDASWDANGGYLSSVSSNNNYMKTIASLASTAEWSISIDPSTFLVTAIAGGSFTRNELRYNEGNTRFACYASSSLMSKFYMYKVPGTIVPSISLDKSSLDMSTSSEGETLVANVRNAPSATINWSKVDANNVISLSASTGESVVISPTGVAGSATVKASIVVDEITYEASCLVNVSLPTSKVVVLTSNTTSYNDLDIAGAEAAITQFNTYINNATEFNVINVNDIRVGATSSGGSENNAIDFATAGSSFSMTCKDNLIVSKVTLEAKIDNNGDYTSVINVSGHDKPLTSTSYVSMVFYPFSDTISISASRRTWVTSITLELKVESDVTTAYANYFLSEVVGNCDATGGSNNVDADTWLDAGIIYLGLSEAQQTEISEANADAMGSEIEHAVATYDYVVGKYGTATYDDFMSRNPSPISGSLTALNSVMNSQTNTMIIVVVAICGLTLIGGLVFVSKQKKANKQ